MNTISRCTVLSILCLIIISCSKNDDVDDIDPFESYRYDLWKKMLDDNVQIDYVGTQLDVYDYPDYLNESFDSDHQGIGSIETEGVIISLRSVLLTIETPNVVLLGIGINDLLADNPPIEIIKNVGIIINILQRHNPNVTIFVEQVPPLRADLMSFDFTRRLLTYNEMITVLSANKTNPNSKVISVDMYSGFSDSFFADEAHFNAEGADYVSQIYHDAIIEHCDLAIDLKILPLGDSRVVGYKE